MEYSDRASQRLLITEKRELIFGAILAVVSLMAVNFTLFGGLNLGFAVAAVLCIGVSGGYLLLSGSRPNAYGLTVLVLCAVIAAGFGRSDDGFVKFVLVIFLFLGVTLGLCLLAGKNRFSPNGFCSLGDSFATFFGNGFGMLEPAFRGLAHRLRSGGKLGRAVGAAALGLCIVFPILLVVVPLLISADAAFDGLIALLPRLNVQEFFATLILGAVTFCVLYSLSVGLVRGEAEARYPAQERKGLSPVTVNTVLGMVCGVYLLYLVSQLAYVSGGFSGLLPADFTLAEYARRGFFEMAALCAVNLGIIALSLGTVRKQERAPRSVQLFCLFLGLVSLFLVASASAKMFLYIESYGLTRLRLLTQIIMLFLALSTAVVTVWLFVPKLPYMKVIVLTALVIGAAVIWMDVDSVVAACNVNAYLSGSLAQIDVSHLRTLGAGAAPHIARLAQQAEDPAVRAAAKEALSHISSLPADLRDWNWSLWNARQYIK